MTARTPTLAQVIRDGISARLSEVHTAMPGEVVDYDGATRTATIKPLLKRVDTDPEGNVLVEQYPNIYNVPVVQPGNNEFFISFPLQAGDPVLLCSVKHDIDDWFENGGLSEPASDRSHALTDCFAIVGGQDKNAAEAMQSASANGMHLGKSDDDAQIFIKSDEIALGGEGSTDYAALESKVQIELGKIQAELVRLAALIAVHDTALVAHQHAYVIPLIPLPGPQPGPTAPFVPPLPVAYTNAYTRAATNSALVKVKK